MATAIDCRDSHLRSEDHAVHVVAMHEVVFVAFQDRAQSVKNVVGVLRAVGRRLPRFHRLRGCHETLCLGGRFWVKRTMVKPRGVLSLQSHTHRSEHWLEVEDTAEVTNGDDVRVASEHESICIPLGLKHWMGNLGQLPMYLIERQTRAYFVEDDIARYEVMYNTA